MLKNVEIISNPETIADVLRKVIHDYFFIYLCFKFITKTIGVLFTMLFFLVLFISFLAYLFTSFYLLSRYVQQDTFCLFQKRMQKMKQS